MIFHYGILDANKVTLRRLKVAAIKYQNLSSECISTANRLEYLLNKLEQSNDKEESKLILKEIQSISTAHLTVGH